MVEPGIERAAGSQAADDAAASIAQLIEENRRLRADLARLGPLAEVGLLSAGAAHDLNNLLQLVAGHAAQLGSTGHADRVTLQRLNQATDSACGLAQRLARWAKDDGTHSGSSDLEHVVRHVLDLASPSTPDGVEVTLELADRLPLARIASHNAHRIVLNLVLNAWHALHEMAGRVVVRTGSSPPDRVWVEVEDSGVGMDEASRLRLFEPFFSSHAAGSGLGLPVIRTLVDAAGGAIEVWSASGRGSRFRITLPIASAGPD